MGKYFPREVLKRVVSFSLEETVVVFFEPRVFLKLYFNGWMFLSLSFLRPLSAPFTGTLDKGLNQNPI